MGPNNIFICIAKLPSFMFRHARFGFYMYFPNVVVSHSAYSRNVHCNFAEANQLSKVRFPLPSLHCSTKFETIRTVKFFPGVPPTPLYDTGIHPNLPRQSFYIRTGHFSYVLFTWQSAYQSMVSFVYLLHDFDANNQTVSMRHYSSSIEDSFV